jgi:hypothetical protein
LAFLFAGKRLALPMPDPHESRRLPVSVFSDSAYAAERTRQARCVRAPQNSAPPDVPFGLSFYLLAANRNFRRRAETERPSQVVSINRRSPWVATVESVRLTSVRLAAAFALSIHGGSLSVGRDLAFHCRRSAADR